MCERCDQALRQVHDLALAFFDVALAAKVDQRVLVEALLQAAHAVASSNPALTPGAAQGALNLYKQLQLPAAASTTH